MPPPWLGLLLVPAILAGLIVGVKWASGCLSLHPEMSRKLVHIIMGLVALSFPWLFRESWPALLLAFLSITALTATRLITPLRHRFGAVLHGVQRRSLGELVFPAAVAVLFLLSTDNRLLYIIPLLTLSLADAVAALVGVRYGQHRYETSEGTKSAEGSFAFFAVAFMSAHVPLLLMSDTGRAESLLLGLVIGILVMLLEAVSVGGMDNLFIPLGCYALLKRYLTLGSDELLYRFGAVCLLALLVFFWRRRTTLKDSGLLAATIVGYLNLCLGGLPWLFVTLLLFFTYTRLWPESAENSAPFHTVRVIFATAAPGLIWLIIAVETDRSGLYYPFLTTYLVNSVIIGLTQLGYTRPKLPAWQQLAWAVSLSWLVFLPAFFFLTTTGWGKADATSGLMAAMMAIPLSAVAGGVYLRLKPFLGVDDAGKRRWFGIAVIVLTVSSTGTAVLIATGII